MKEINLIVKNSTGLHARPAVEIVNCVNEFESKIIVKKEGLTFNPNSMMSLMSMEAKPGTELNFTIEGSDEIDAFKELKIILDRELC